MGPSAIGLNDSVLRFAVRSLKTEIHRLPAWQQRDAVGNAQSRLETRFSKSITESTSSIPPERVGMVSEGLGRAADGFAAKLLPLAAIEAALEGVARKHC